MATEDIIDIVDIVEDVDVIAATFPPTTRLTFISNEAEIYEEELEIAEGLITSKPTIPPVFFGAEPEPESRPEPYPEGEAESIPEGEYEPNGLYAEPEPPLFDDKQGLPIYSTLAAVIATLIIVLNIAVLIVLARKPKQRKSLSWLIGLISTFDLIGGLQFLWFSSFDLHLMLTHANMWIIVMCGIWMITMAPQISALIHFGLHWINELDVGVNNAKFTTGRILFITLTIFVLPIALFIPPIAGWNCIGCGEPRECAKECSMVIFPFTKSYVLLMAILLFAAITLVISIYGYIHWTMSNKQREGKLSPKSNNSLYRVTSAMVKVYILFTLPVSIVLCFDYATVEENGALMTAFHATLFVSFLSNLVDPIIIFLGLRSMRETKWERCCDSKCDKNKEVRMTESHETRFTGNNGLVDEKQLEDTKEAESASAV